MKLFEVLRTTTWEVEEGFLVLADSEEEAGILGNENAHDPEILDADETNCCWRSEPVEAMDSFGRAYFYNDIFDYLGQHYGTVEDLIESEPELFADLALKLKEKDNGQLPLHF